LQVKDGSGRWRQRALRLEDSPANRERAEQQLAELRTALKAREDAGAGSDAVTVRTWGKRWLDDRPRHVRDSEHDETHLRVHVYPTIGRLALDEVRPRHLVAIMDAMRESGLAPRTRRNVYSTIRSMFNDAAVADLLPVASNPCILTHRQIGKIKDSPKFQRAAAVFAYEELGALVYDPRVPEDRRAWYALLGLGMLRTGEAAGLRWASVQRAEPLGRLVVATSYDHGMTKTDVPRWMPIHPALASVLAAWKLGGWARTFGRPPTDADLVVPVPAPKNRGPRKLVGAMRDRHWARKRMVADFAELGLRHRRAHDLRRTGISLAQDGGADSRVLRWGTHAPPGETIDSYTTLAWSTLCRAVSSLLTPRAPELTSKDTEDA
jgi:integrase